MTRTQEMKRGAYLGIFLFTMIGCGGVTTPIGQLERLTRFRHLLPEEVLVRSPSYADANEHKIEVRVAGTKARVVVHVRSFEDNNKVYFLSVAFEVVKSVAGLEIHSNVGEPQNVRKDGKVVQSLPIFVSWVKSSSVSGIQRGSNGGLVYADGTWEPE